MRRSAYVKNIFREIRGSFGRFLAIFVISALGVGFFAGLRVCNRAMTETADGYIRENALYDFRILSTLGFDRETADTFSGLSGIKESEGAVYQDAEVCLDGGDREIYRIHSLTKRVNRVSVTEGKMPEKAGEIALDFRYCSPDSIGKTVEIVSTDGENGFSVRSFTVTGLVKTPYYLNYERGNTALGTGSLTAYAYTPRESFTLAYDMEIFLSFEKVFAAYSDAYDTYAEKMKAPAENLGKKAARDRYLRIYAEGESEICKGEAEISDGEKKLLEAQNELDQGKNDLLRRQKQTNDLLSEKENILREAEQELRSAGEALSLRESALAQQENALLSAGMPLTPELISAKEQLSDANALLQTRQNELTEGKIALADSRKEAEAAFSEAEAEILQGEKEIRERKADLEKAKQKLSEAKAELSELKEPECYTLTRKENVGYVCFENDAAIVDGIARVFPVFFFLVAALICMTTMTRMCEEQRGQIGTLKALGYGRGRIMKKFTVYSGLAALTGCVGGFFLGTFAFPRIIWMTYDIMYGFEEIRYVFDPALGLLSLIAGLVCSLGVTAFCCGKITRETPADLMRPKAPKPGKRILLERIPFVWKPMKFLHKVTCRNLFRYKARFIMMVLGIGGCTALLVTGFGISDSIANVVSYQYDEISLYDYSLTLEPTAFSRCADLEKELRSLETDPVFLRQVSMDAEAGGRIKTTETVLSPDTRLYSLVDLHDKNGKLPSPQKGQAVVSIGLARSLGLDTGDRFILRDADRETLELTVSGICENYIYNYVFLTPEDFGEAFGSPFANTVYLLGQGGLGAKLSGLSGVTAVTEVESLRKRFTDVLSSMDFIVLTVILCAAALAFVVLYNLTNINITERVREIATLKVLGFFPGETAAYVYRENTVLTVLGAMLGLFLGKGLHAYVMDQIHIDLMYFDVRVTAVSYLISFGMTLLFSLAVNLFMRRKLGEISMTESLKSVE